MFVIVALNVPLYQKFEYKINNYQSNIGKRVKVSFNNSEKVGLIIEEYENKQSPSNIDIKDVIQVLDETPILDTHIINLLHWVAKYYHHPIGETFFLSIPQLLKKEKKAQDNEIEYWGINTQCCDTELRGKKICKTMEYLKNRDYTYKELNELGINRQILSKLQTKNLIHSYFKVKPTKFWFDSPLIVNNKKTLNEEQQRAYKTIINTLGYKTYVLNGVTGSGKTEVYLHCIEFYLRQKQQAAILVPEINLTPQTIARFKERFSAPIVAIHSGMTPQERLSSFQKMQNKEAAILIGTRSALFCPIPDLGIIIIDEEHDSSYKQCDGLKYNAKDTAVMYSHLRNIPIILGSATPSFETINNIFNKKYSELKLIHKATNVIDNKFKIIDMRYQNTNHGISETVINAIFLEISNNNQVLVMLNRRGYSTKMICHSCGYVFRCNNCEVNLCYHKEMNCLQCHHCETKYPIPSSCPICGNRNIQQTGIGTEQVYAYLTKTFQNVHIARIDRDSTKIKGNLDNYLKKIQDNYYKILVGTQILAKGHHFPHLTLVCILDIDSYLYSNDYRSLEKLAQLITQVSGRAGREHKEGTVMLQTHYPKHIFIEDIIKNGYMNFAINNLNIRKQSNLPPYTKQALIRIESHNKKNAIDTCNSVYAFLVKNINDNKLVYSQPYPQVIERKQNKYYYQILLQSLKRNEISDCINLVLSQIHSFTKGKYSKITIEIDPETII